MPTTTLLLDWAFDHERFASFTASQGWTKGERVTDPRWCTVRQPFVDEAGAVNAELVESAFADASWLRFEGSRGDAWLATFREAFDREEYSTKATAIASLEAPEDDAEAQIAIRAGLVFADDAEMAEALQRLLTVCTDNGSVETRQVVLNAIAFLRLPALVEAVAAMTTDHPLNEGVREDAAALLVAVKGFGDSVPPLPFDMDARDPERWSRWAKRRTARWAGRRSPRPRQPRRRATGTHAPCAHAGDSWMGGAILACPSTLSVDCGKAVPKAEPQMGAAKSSQSVMLYLLCAALLPVTAMATVALKQWFIDLSVPPLRELRQRHEQRVRQPKLPWKRPVLHGKPVAKNAAMEQARIVASMGRLPNREQADEAFFKALRAEKERLFTALIQREGDKLDRLLATAQFDHAWTEIKRAVEGSQLPPLARHRFALQMLLVRAMRVDVDTCLGVATKVLRLGQDASAGTGIVGTFMFNRLTQDVKLAINTCRHASRKQLLRTRDEILVLLRNPIPIGRVLETELTTHISWLAMLAPAGPIDDESLRIWARMDATIAQLRKVRNWDFPAAFVKLSRLADRIRDQGVGPSVSDLVAVYLDKYIHDHVRAVARMRALVVALDAMASGDRGVRPKSAERQELHDPFSGKPLSYQHMKKCAVVWSVGENRINDSKVVGTLFQKGKDDVFVWACFE